LKQGMQTLDDTVADVRLIPGDVLLVPENDNKISILGEVHAPAVYSIPDGEELTPATALALAGGPMSDANTHNGSILRRDASGTVKVIPVNFSAILSGKATGDGPSLQSGDIIYLPAKGQNNFNPLSLIGLLPLL
jgi:polysaccharide biosynthesis/export protein